MATQEQVGIEARRAAVAEGVLARRSYRSMASEFGVSVGTIAGDVTALRKEWAKTFGKTGDAFERSLMDIDALQAETIDTMRTLQGTEKLAAVGTAIKLIEQRNRLLNLYPRPTNADGQELPTGPITLEISLVEKGNRRLVTDATITEIDELALAEWSPNEVDDGN